MSEPLREYDPASLPPASALQTGTPKRLPAKRGEGAKKAAAAWRARNREYLRRRSLRIETVEQALATWRDLAPSRSARPSGGESRPTVVGDSAERQVWARVELDRQLLAPGETLADRVARWVPETFYDPVPPLCGKEMEEMADEERIRERLEAARQERASSVDTRLLPGMVRQ